MKHTRLLRLAAPAAGLMTAAAVGDASAQSGTWALTNVRIQTVTNGVIDRGVVLIRNGLIEAVGPTIAIPTDAVVVDLSGRTVSPGIIDLSSTIGAPSTTPSGETARGVAPTPAPVGRPQGLDPARSIAAELKLTPADLKSAREAGITAILVAVRRGGFRGQSALVPTKDSAEQRDVIRAPVAIHMGFQPNQGGYPATLLGLIAYERQTLYDAQRYGLLADRYHANPRGLARPGFDPGLEALVPAIRGTMPVFFEAGSENEIRRAVRIAGEFGLKLTVVGATEGFRALDALAGATAVVSVNYPKPPEATGWAYRLTRRDGPDSASADSVTRRALESNPAMLEKAGIKFALGSGGVRPGDYLKAVRKAIAQGLSPAAALQAMTIRAAELAGLGSALGSIEPGKIANLVVTEKADLLADSARIRLVFVDGIRYDVAAPPPAARTQSGGTVAASINGTWAMTVSSPQGPVEVTMTINQSGSGFGGTMTSTMGSSSIDDGQINGKAVSWATTIQMGGQSITMTFQGEVDGNKMTGSGALGSFGNASFTADRKP